METAKRGFTLVELVVVVAIVAMLAATALPRYTAMQTQSRVAKLLTTLGAVKGAAALAHGACLATTTPVGCGSTAFSLVMEGLGVGLLNQYPTADAAGIVAAAGLTLTEAEGFDSTGGGAAAGDILTIRVLGTDPANCSFTYTAPMGKGVAPVFGAPVVTGC